MIFHKKNNGLTMSQGYTGYLAFTLAEVLITLGIIGIVAAITIPTLVQNSQKAGFVEGLKKNYSVLSNMVSLYETDNNCIGDLSACSDFNGTDIMTKWNALKPYLNLSRDCGTDIGCFAPGNYQALNPLIPGTNYDSSTIWVKGILADGTSIGMANSNCANSTDNCVEVSIDVNGQKKPNIIGRDFFLLYINANKVVGIGSDPIVCSTTVMGINGHGWTCSTYLLRNGTMDY